jgi:hypothetical protein
MRIDKPKHVAKRPYAAILPLFDKKSSENRH